MLRVESLSKAFGEKKLFSDLSFEVGESGTVAIRGKSGCGKTTLFRIILGLEKADGGKIASNAKRIRAVFQDDRLLENRNAVENLLFVNGEDREKAVAILESCGLGDSLDLPASKLSGGMKRRVALARAIYANPDLLLLDEPFNALDAENKAIMIRLTEEYAKKHPVLIITHSDDEARDAITVNL